MRHPRRRVAPLVAPLVALMLALAPAAVLGEEKGGGKGGGGGGGGGGENPTCPWAQDHVVNIGSKRISLPHALFRSTEVEHEVEGYHVTIDKTYYFITFVSPDGMTYQAGLTRMENKRCVAYFLGRPVFLKRVE